MSARGKKSLDRRPARPYMNIGRPISTKDENPAILIVCEGSKTEPYYIDDMQRALRLTSMDVISGDESGTNPKSITDRAKEEFKKRQRDGLTKENVWCVFDRDDHEKVPDALIMAKDNGFNVCFSNPCFELWFLLHFENQTATIHRTAVEKKLKKMSNIPGYEKGMEGVYDKIKEEQLRAIGYAESLRTKHTGDGNKETSNPSTTADKLIRFLYKAANKELT